MTFYREGKKFNYYEVIQMLKVLKEEGILYHLDEKEISSLYRRVFDFSNDFFSEYLMKSGYAIIDMKQSVLTLESLKRTNKGSIWRDGIQIYEDIKAGKSDRERIITYMDLDLLEAMKEMNNNLADKSYSYA